MHTTNNPTATTFRKRRKRLAYLEVAGVQANLPDDFLQNGYNLSAGGFMAILGMGLQQLLVSLVQTLAKVALQHGGQHALWLLERGQAPLASKINVQCRFPNIVTFLKKEGTSNSWR